MPASPPRPTTPQAGARLQRVEKLSYFLDNAIQVPGTRFRIGYDALLGLVPGVGDLAGVALSAYIIYEAGRLGVGWATLLRMMANVGLEALVGVVPLLGDLFDAAWKANARNIDLLHAHTGGTPTRRLRSNRTFLLGLVAVLLVLLVGAGLLIGWGVLALLGALAG